MAGRQSRGRQRIPMRRINSPDDLYATFSKRRLGLYKKASELSTLCNADVGVVIFSPTNNPFSFWHPSPEAVIERYQHPHRVLDDQTRLGESNKRTRIEFLNLRLDQLLDEKERCKEREKLMDEAVRNRPTGWWEQLPVESLSPEQVRAWKVWFNDLLSKVKTRIDELDMRSMFMPGPSSQFLNNFYNNNNNNNNNPNYDNNNNVPQYHHQQAPLQLYGDGTGGHFYNYQPLYAGNTGYHNLHQSPGGGLYNYNQLMSQEASTSASAAGIPEGSRSRWGDNNP